MIYNSKLNKLIRSIVALVLILTLLVTATYAWLSNSTSTKVDANEFITITADAGLNMNYGYGDNNQGTMQIPKDCVLTECSSRDGKNFYFPLSAFGEDGDRDFTDGIEQVDDFIYREATGLDKNKKYISLDLELSAENDSSVWLSNESYIRNQSDTQTSANAVRVAFIDKEIEGKSVVFDNSPSKEYSEDNFNKDHYRPIGSINRDGTGPSTNKNPLYRPHALSEYTHSGEVLFELKAGVPRHITVNIWLEGTDPDCTNSILNIEDLNILIKFSTSYEAKNTYYFKDYTLEQWVEDEECYVFAMDDNNNLYSFSKSANYENDLTWFGEIPESVTNVRFVRYNPELQSGSPQEWNYWEAGELGPCKTYNAFGHSAGMWADTFSPTTITLFDGTPDGFVHCNLYDNEDASQPFIVHLEFYVEDGNGNNSYHNYKLSYHHNRTQWQINIPSQATDINFYMYETEDYHNDTPINLNQPEYTWETTRSNELYYTMNFDNDYNSVGYWSNELIYVDAHSEGDFKEGNSIAAYFYDTQSDFTSWVSMFARTDNGRYKAAVPPELMQSNMVDENPDTTTVYFTNSQGWSTPKVHCWETVNGADNALTTWPGITMTKSHKNGYGQDIYKAQIPSNTTGLLFSDNGSGSKRTNDIKNVSLYDGIGFYANSDKTYGTFTDYRASVIITQYTPDMFWDWGNVNKQTSDDLTTYGTNNLFKITGCKADDDYYFTGKWSYESNP